MLLVNRYMKIYLKKKVSTIFLRLALYAPTDAIRMSLPGTFQEAWEREWRSLRCGKAALAQSLSAIGPTWMVGRSSTAPSAKAEMRAEGTVL